MSTKRTIAKSFTVSTIEDGVSVQAQYAPNDNPTSSQIHNTWRNGDLYMRTKSTEDGASWSAWHKVVGENGGETDYRFNISSQKTSTNAITPPTNCAYNNWSDSPITTNELFPYLWMQVVKKTWSDARQDYISDTPHYVRITGEESIEYFVEGALSTFKLKSFETATDVSCTYSFYQKSAVSSSRSAIAAYYAVYLRTGSTFSLLTMNTGYSNHGRATSVTINANVPYYGDGSTVYDAVVIYIFASEYYNTSPESQSYMAKKEISLVKDGEDSFTADLTNEMDSIECNEQGYPKSSQTISTKAMLYIGSDSLPVTITIYDNNTSGAQYTSGTKRNGVTVSWSNDAGQIYCNFATDTAQPERRVFCIKLTSNTQRISPAVERLVYLTVNCLRGTAVYRLVPSTNSIVLRKDKVTREPSGNITCDVEKMLNGETITPPTTDYSLRMKVNHGLEQNYAAVDASTITSGIEYILRVPANNGTIVDRETIPLIKDGIDGINAFVADLENEMKNVALTEGGNTLTAVDFYFKVQAFYGTTNVLSDNECTVSASCSDSNVILITTEAKTTGIRVQVAQNVALANSTDITVKVEHTTYGTRTVIFTLAGVRGGKNAVLQELLPKPNVISFARLTDGSLTPASRDLALSIKKTQGNQTTEQDISSSGLTIKWSVASMPSTSSEGTSWGQNPNPAPTGITWNNAATMQIANTVEATNIYIAAFNSSSGTLVDRETIPVIKDGKKGDKGDDSVTAYASPDKISVPCNANGGVKAELTTDVIFSLKVGGNTASVTGVSTDSRPSNVVVNDVYTNAKKIKVPTSQTASGIASGCVFTVTGTYNSKTYSAKVTVALIGSTQGNQGNPGGTGPAGKDAKFIRLKGTGGNNSQTAICETFNGTTLDTRSITSRGLTFIKVNRSTLAVTSLQTYDVYGDSVSSGEQAIASLVSDINATTSDYFVCLVSYDAVRWNMNLINALMNCGSMGIGDATAWRVPFAFVGYRGLQRGLAVQAQSGIGSQDPPAEIVAYVSNGQLALNVENANGRLNSRFYYNAGTYVSSSSLTFHVDKNEAPYFLYDGDYWVFEPADITATYYTTAQMGTPSSSDSNWHMMFYNKQKFFMSDVMFAQYAHLGSFVFNGDWQLSTNGVINDVAYNNGANISGSIWFAASGSTNTFSFKAYTLFKPTKPKGENDVVLEITTAQIINRTSTELYMGQVYLDENKTYYLTLTGRCNNSNYPIYFRVERVTSSTTYTKDVFTFTTTSTDYSVGAFKVVASGYYKLKLVQPYVPSSSSTTAGGSLTYLYLASLNFAPIYAVDGLTGNSYQQNAYIRGTIYADNGEFNGIVKANLMYSPTMRIEAATSYTINPSTAPYHTYYITCGNSNTTITLPDATTYDGLELRFFFALITRTAGEPYLENSVGIYKEGSSGILQLVTSLKLTVNKFVIVMAMQGYWYVVS